MASGPFTISLVFSAPDTGSRRYDIGFLPRRSRFRLVSRLGSRLTLLSGRYDEKWKRSHVSSLAIVLLLEHDGFQSKSCSSTPFFPLLSVDCILRLSSCSPISFLSLLFFVGFCHFFPPYFFIFDFSHHCLPYLDAIWKSSKFSRDTPLVRKDVSRMVVEALGHFEQHTGRGGLCRGADSARQAKGRRQARSEGVEKLSSRMDAVH
ncbi:hypothetical protein VTH06DRAFT_7460 [Thermothelomyces fergusii]